ncbi:hypothetical protein KFE25_001636 [Diacronema lutheri]|uniref:JmjC domain-containing protein n=1 Tax=Diacronema lutheri TaxID=2081491 RepID=A0A8J6CCU8_DIALT|nr:hypothetical protein KFE25_001636 [Diacronema lutheri]
MERGEIADLRVREAEDLKALLGACTSVRLRAVIEAELRAALASLIELAADLTEVRRLLAEARRQNSRALLERDAVRLEAALAGAPPLLAAAFAEGLATPTPIAAGLPDFCWRSPHKQPLPVPIVSAGEPAEVMQRLKAGEPFVLTGSRLCMSAVGKWTPAYLCAHFGETALCTVFESADANFRYWDGRKNRGNYHFPDEAHTRKELLTMRDFYAKTRRALTNPAAPRAYLQTGLVEGVGAQLVRDFARFDWAWAKSLSATLGWGALSSNVVFVGMAGHTTPAHFDEQQNLLAQLCGRKRLLLWRPADWPCLYPFPLFHPCDRQTSLDLRAVDLAKFPKFADAQPLEAVLQPGDVLFLPQYWWHHVENLDDDCVSVNFWYVDNAQRDVQLPISEKANVALRRNVERMMAEKAGTERAHAVFAELALGKPEAELAEDTRSVLDYARVLLRNVFTSEEVIERWLVELTVGRFT